MPWFYVKMVQSSSSWLTWNDRALVALVTLASIMHTSGSKIHFVILKQEQLLYVKLYIFWVHFLYSIEWMFSADVSTDQSCLWKAFGKNLEICCKLMFVNYTSGEITLKLNSEHMYSDHTSYPSEIFTSKDLTKPLLHTSLPAT